MDGEKKQPAQLITTLLISVYGLFITIITLFSIFWNNKGANSFLDKSLTDWLAISCFLIASFIVWYSAFVCYSAKYLNKPLFLLLVVIFIISVPTFVLEASGEALLYSGPPHLFLLVGLYLWWRSTNHANIKP